MTEDRTELKDKSKGQEFNQLLAKRTNFRGGLSKDQTLKMMPTMNSEFPSLKDRWLPSYLSDFQFVYNGSFLSLHPSCWPGTKVNMTTGQNFSESVGWDGRRKQCDVWWKPQMGRRRWIWWTPVVFLERMGVYLPVLSGPWVQSIRSEEIHWSIHWSLSSIFVGHRHWQRW